MILRPSALKHGIPEEAAVFAATNGCRFTASLDDDYPQREFRLGFDQSMRLLELVVSCAGTIKRRKSSMR